ncbi:unnamed protein product [Rhizophagus irregularis]|nr:unnamed protein product [Rhizophagus irregularis]
MESACKEFVKQQMTSPKQMPNTSETVEDHQMEIEISEMPQTPKHQSKVAAQQKEPIGILSAKATPFTPKGCKAFKIIQDRSTRKLITYYESWADLEKVLGKAFSLDEFTGDWVRYFTPNLKQRRRNPQKVNQEGDSKVRTTNSNTQSSKKQKVAKEIKNIDKALGGIDKLTILAEIRSMLRKLGAS